MDILFYALIGFVVGVFTGVFGIGGGSVRIPLLAATGMPLVTAFATNMFAIPFSSAIGAYIHRRHIAWSFAGWFSLGGVSGIIIATLFVGSVSSGVLAVLFFVAALITVFGLYLDRISPKLSMLFERSPRNLFFGAFFGNLLIGLRGGSGGTLYPPILRSMRFEMRESIATALFAGCFSSIAALVLYAIGGYIAVVPGLIVAGTGMLGSAFGSHISLRIDGRWLAAGLSITVICLAFLVLIMEFG